MVSKFFRSCTTELFLSYVFLYGKIAFTFLFLNSDVRAAIYYGIFCFMLWLVLSFPRYQGPSKLQKVKTKDELEEALNMPILEIERSGKRGALPSKQKKDFTKI